MDWIHEYQLFLFDLDGLLVNTEELHFRAYKNMLLARGFELPWNFNRYCRTAHYHADKIGDEFYELFPELQTQEASWPVLYAEKKQAMINLVNTGEVQLMPGVIELLQALQDAQIKRCVVTHSPDELVEPIREFQPILNTIPYWITRTDYSQPKPRSECYITSIEKYAKPGEKVIGFEDTPRGLRALLGTTATPILITSIDYPEIPDFIRQGVKHFTSFKQVLKDNLS